MSQRLGLVLLHRTEPLVFTCVESARIRLIALTELDKRMIAALLDDRTVCSDNSKTVRDITVQIPQCLHEELNSRFPLNCRRSDTRANNLNLQRIAVLVISRALRDKDCLICYNQEILEEITNSKQRGQLVRFFNNPHRFRTVKQSVPSRNCKGRLFVNTALEQTQVYRHNGSGVVGVGFDGFCWKFSAIPTLPFCLPSIWRLQFHQSFIAASERLWPGSMRFVSLISKSLAAVAVEEVSPEVFMGLAIRRFQNGDLKVTPQQAAAIYSQTWQDFQRHPLDDIIRKNGRCYYGITNQPKDLRRSHLKFQHNGLVPPSEIDMSSTYPVCLAMKCLSSKYGRTKSTDRFIRDVVSGDFYSIIAEAAGPSYTRMSYKSKKEAFAIECLFGNAKWFGSTPLFRSFDKQYRDPACLVASIRKKPFGERALSNMLNEIEGDFFIDTVLPALHALGILALPIHDAVMVPEPECVRALACIRNLCNEYFGFDANFKVSRSSVE